MLATRETGGDRAAPTTVDHVPVPSRGVPETVRAGDRAEQRALRLGRLLVDLTKALDEQQRLLADLTGALEEERRHVASLDERLTAQDRELTHVLTSKSWRWTAPMRQLMRLGRAILVGLRNRRRNARTCPITAELETPIAASPACRSEAPSSDVVHSPHPWNDDLPGDVAWLGAVGSYLDTLFTRAQDTAGVSLEYVPLAADGVDSAALSVKLIAFYLPQFHPIKENDEWWGRGFTEWTNVSKAVPQFRGHYQPHLPGELGFYDLRLVEIQRRQIELAQQYGVYGFCFHFYWFGGRRLLERPLEAFLENSDLDFRFCLCWANENWTRRWDGAEHDILIGQEHSPDDDLNLISALGPALSDKRYIRIDGRALLVVYRVSLLPDPRGTAQRWREYCRQSGHGELLLVAAQSFEVDDPRVYGFDAAVEFPPHPVSGRPEITSQLDVLNPRYQGRVYDYRAMAASFSERPWPEFTLFKTVSPGWDNEARRPGRGSTYHYSTPLEYARWLRLVCEGTLRHREESERLVFVNAWNEWGEGAHLEPDRRHGYGYLHATANVLRYFARVDDAALKRLQTIQQQFKRRSDHAVIIHLYYDDLLDEIGVAVRRTGLALDALISVRADVRLDTLNLIEREFPNAYVYAVENRGRDIRPFFHALRVISALGYQLAAKLHTKKTLHAADGRLWRDRLFADLMPDPTTATAIVRAFNEDPALGLLSAADGLMTLADCETNFNNRAWLARILPLLDAADLLDGYQTTFPAGSMFWFRVSALKGLQVLESIDGEFEMEVGQVDGTLAHAVERVFGVAVERAGYRTASIEEIFATGEQVCSAPQ